MTPELPRAPCSAPAASAAATCGHVAAAVERVGLRPGRTHGEQHVCPGVGVGDREHVEPVDLVGVGDQVADGGVCPVPQGGGVEPPSRPSHTSHPPCRTSLAGASLAKPSHHWLTAHGHWFAPVDSVLVIACAARYPGQVVGSTRRRSAETQTPKY